MFLVAHYPECDIVKLGPTTAVPVIPGTFSNRATPCSCGGQMVRVDLDMRPDGHATLNIPTGGRE